jgi:replication-associated recombination protein RarA
MINFKDGHTCVFGRTRSGKTYRTKQIIKRMNEGVLFFNTQHEKMPSPFLDADGRNSFYDIKKALQSKKKVNFLPTTDKQLRQSELEYLIKQIYDTKGLNMVLVVDEVHLFKKEALDMIEEVSTTGLRWGINMVAISQRPAKVSNTIITQSNNKIFFEMDTFEGQYMRNYGMDYNIISDKLEQGGKYSYIIYNGKDYKGPFKN